VGQGTRVTRRFSRRAVAWLLVEAGRRVVDVLAANFD
jgi:hypothetical protein